MKISAPQVTAFHINGGVAVKPMIQGAAATTRRAQTQRAETGLAIPANRECREPDHPEIYHPAAAGFRLRADHRVLDEPGRAKDPKTEEVAHPVLPVSDHSHITLLARQPPPAGLTASALTFP
jgi:hypothetical protein